MLLISVFVQIKTGKEVVWIFLRDIEIFEVSIRVRFGAFY